MSEKRFAIKPRDTEPSAEEINRIFKRVVVFMTIMGALSGVSIAHQTRPAQPGPSIQKLTRYGVGAGLGAGAILGAAALSVAISQRVKDD